MDAAYATHPDMKGHTGATFTMGQGSIYSNSLKQKLVARSSTEAELVGVHDILPQILWTRNFFNVARLSGTKEYNISGKHERNVVREQWAQIQHKMDQAYRVTIFPYP